MEDRFLEKTGSIDKMTGDKLRGDQEPLLEGEKYNLPSGDEVRQVKEKQSSSFIVELDESGTRQPDKIFTTLSNSAHKHRSLSELKSIVRQCFLSWRQVVRQLEKGTSSNSAHKDCFSSESDDFPSGDEVCRVKRKLSTVYTALPSRLENKLHEKIDDFVETSNYQPESTITAIALAYQCQKEFYVLHLNPYQDDNFHNELRELETVRDRSGIPHETPKDYSPELNIFDFDDMPNVSKDVKNQDVRDLLGIPHKTLGNYSYKQSNSNIDMFELLNKIRADDLKDPFENNSLIILRKILDNLLAAYTKKYGNLFKEARSRVSQVRKHTESCHVVASRDMELFPEGSLAGNVQKLMKKDLNRLGAGGNGEIVETFYQRKHLVVKKTLLRELELSVVPKLEHRNLLPWFAIISGEKSERRPGQVSCYQIMEKMTEDLSASIRTIGGSIHDHILSLQQDSVPKAAVSQQAELMRRNTSGVFRNVLEGLQYLHEQGLVHRDIKASNILLKKPKSCAHTSIFTCDCTPHWEVKVADFDSIGQIFVLRERAAMRGKKRLQSGCRPFLKVSATGTSGYRAPEIFEEFTTSDMHDPQYFSPASDIWALGGVGIHVVMGFCTPRKQYQFGLMMLAHRGMLKGKDRDNIISRTLGLHHIREGFPGEKWNYMINFVSRPLQIDWDQRPSAKDLLQDPFIQRYNATPGLDTVQETATLDTATPTTIEVHIEPQQIENRFNDPLTPYGEQQCEDQSDGRLSDNEGENRTPPPDTVVAASQSYLGQNEDESSDPSDPPPCSLPDSCAVEDSSPPLAVQAQQEPHDEDCKQVLGAKTPEKLAHLLSSKDSQSVAPYNISQSAVVEVVHSKDSSPILNHRSSVSCVDSGSKDSDRMSHTQHDRGTMNKYQNNTSEEREALMATIQQQWAKRKAEEGIVTQSRSGAVVFSRCVDFPRGSSAPLPSKEAMSAFIGKGGYGVVSYVYHNGKEFAVKETCLRDDELLTLSKLSHRNVMEISAVIEGERHERYHGGRACYQLMPRVAGDVKKMMDDRGMPTLCHYSFKFKTESDKASYVLGNAKFILRGALSGLQYLHKIEVVHRDVKLQNILIDVRCNCEDIFQCPHEGDSGYRVYISDFDSVLDVERTRKRLEKRSEMRLPVRCSVHGTPGYRPPEACYYCSSNEVIPSYLSTSQDIWSFGCTLMKFFVGSSGPSTQKELSSVKLSHCLQQQPSYVTGVQPSLRHSLTVGDEEMKKFLKVSLLEKYFPLATELHNLTQGCLKVDQTQRPTVEEILKHPFFKLQHGDSPSRQKDELDPPKELGKPTACASDGCEKPNLVTDHLHPDSIHPWSSAVESNSGQGLTSSAESCCNVAGPDGSVRDNHPKKKVNHERNYTKHRMRQLKADQDRHERIMEQ